MPSISITALFPSFTATTVLSPATLKYSYSLDGINYTDIGGELDCADLSDEAYGEIGHEGHTGTFIGMCCHDLSGGEIDPACHADFEFFTYKQTK